MNVDKVHCCYELDEVIDSAKENKFPEISDLAALGNNVCTHLKTRKILLL
jgi:hypothetical protein